jgi:HD-like signal output (HDOD) protein
VEELARLREDEDRVGVRNIAQVLLHDPLFTLRVLRYLQAHRRNVQTADITTLEHAVMMLGITPFFTHFADLPVVEMVMASQPLAMDGLMRVAYRSHHAALYARDWANLRSDSRADEIAIAALLHDLAEMLLWCFAPAASLRISEMMRTEEHLRSSVAQTRLLGFKLSQLQLKLIAEWRLAPVLQELMNDSHGSQPRSANAALAVSLARHSVSGWDNPALPDDYVAIQQLLKLSLPDTVARIKHTALEAQAARDWYHIDDKSTSVGPDSPPDGVKD